MSPSPSERPRPLRFAALVTSEPVPAEENGWRRLLSRQADFDDLERRVRLARALERGRFDAVCFTDPGSLQTRWRRERRGPLEGGFPAPGSDPSVLAGAVAYVTSHLGIVVRASILQEDPLGFARRISTLDHTSNGRIAWSVADDPPGAWTEEYVDVTYKLWEGSWDERRQDSPGNRRDRDGRAYPINHRGARYQVAGPHPVSPSRQRTPLLLREATSPADHAFATSHAEVISIQSSSPAAAANDIAGLRAKAASTGRPPEDMLFFQQLDLPAGPVTSGTRDQFADELGSWRDAGVDGVTLSSARPLSAYEEFVDQVAPVLQARGLMQREYADGSLRHKLFGRGDRLPGWHPAARYRGAFAPGQRTDLQRAEPLHV